jgi:hypothetical protein
MTSWIVVGTSSFCAEEFTEPFLNSSLYFCWEESRSQAIRELSVALLPSS